MPVAVAEAVAASVNRWARTGRFSVVWHGGEPLAAGREHLAALMAPFGAGVEHHVQTNATLIDDAWCEFFAEHEIRVSVSVDGPRGAQRRPGRPGAASRPTTGSCAASTRCAGTTSRSPRSAWSADPRPGLAAELYDYFLDLGCDVLGINVEELEGVNSRDQPRTRPPT